VSAAIPLADAPALLPRARVTFAIRFGLAATAVACVVAFVLVSRHPHTRTLVPLPSHADIVLVLDLSASISSDTYSRIGGTLAALARSGGRFGLVVFSDGAYEALPPGTPASDLAPLVRYFTLPPQRQPGFAQTFPTNPWQSTFTGGTKISAGLDLAHSIALSQAQRATVVLVSDLDDDPGDVSRLASVLAAYRRDRVPVDVVGLNPSPQNVLFFERLLGPRAPLVQAPTLNEVPPHDVTPFPWTLVLLAVAVAAALALREAWSPQLDWGRA
jgi:uncharacterized protein (DUF58 family)